MQITNSSHRDRGRERESPSPKLAKSKPVVGDGRSKSEEVRNETLQPPTSNDSADVKPTCPSHWVQWALSPIVKGREPSSIVKVLSKTRVG